MFKGEQPHKNLEILKKPFFSCFYAEFIQDYESENGIKKKFLSSKVINDLLK